MPALRLRQGSIVRVRFMTLNLDEPMGHIKPAAIEYAICTVIGTHALGCDVKKANGDVKTISVNSIEEVIVY